MSVYQVRVAKDGDYETITEFSKNFAVLANFHAPVKCSPETLKRDRGLYACFVAEHVPTSGSDRRVVVGYTLFTYSYNSWEGKVAFLHDLYVSADHRGNGVGTQLLQRVAKAVLDYGSSALHWCVLKGNKLAVDFYDNAGAVDLTKEEDLHYYEMNEDKLKTLVNQP